MSREVEFCHRDRLIELGLTMTGKSGKGSRTSGCAGVQPRRSRNSHNKARHKESAS